MFKTLIATAALLAVAAAAPASAVTVTFNYLGSVAATPLSVARTSNGVTLTAVARRFSVAPSLLTNVSQFTNGTLRTAALGMGVNGGNSNVGLDTDLTSREAILVTGSRTLRLSGMLLNLLNNGDTLQVFGVNTDTGALESLGYGGQIRTGLAGAATFVNTGANGNTTDLDFVNESPVYTQFVLTTRIDGAANTAANNTQDYRIGSLTFAVPEPQSWALMIVGFGLVGVAARRRKAVVAA